ncbi:MAG: glutathione S-transferase family protein [Rhizobiaceae bacterium]|nr:glutathione S-transferase family protein [Rhizobiaceae bacterium]
MTILLYELAGRDPQRPFSPHCWKVAMALAHKELEFRTVPTPFGGIGAVEGGMSKTVPVIRDGGTVMAESFDIALYLERAYPERPSLFGGPGGEAAARFVERWTQLTIQAQMMRFIVADIHAMLGPEDQSYFRGSRETRLGRTLEEAVAGREERLPAFRASLEPLRNMLSYQPFIGGSGPLFADYIAFGAFQWARVVSPLPLLAGDDPVASWFDRCLDLHGGQGRRAAAA